MDDRWIERLSEYLDGDLGDSETAALEAHLATCAACRGTLESLRAVAARTRVPFAEPPARDLWPGIEARLAPRRATGAGWLEALRGRRLSLSLPQAVAAAAALVVVSGAGAWWALRAPGSSPGAGDATPVAGAPAAGSAALAAFDDRRYEATVSELEALLERNRAVLDTSTVRVVEQNLAIIDRAMAEARRALAADPANPYLNAHLRRQMERKVQVLRVATAAALRRPSLEGGDPT
jgi:anti-sigma factor RsiW